MKFLSCVRPSGYYTIPSENGVTFDSPLDAFRTAVAYHRARPVFYRRFRYTDDDFPSCSWELVFPQLPQPCPLD